MPHSSFFSLAVRIADGSFRSLAVSLAQDPDPETEVAVDVKMHSCSVVLVGQGLYGPEYHLEMTVTRTLPEACRMFAAYLREDQRIESGASS